MYTGKILPHFFWYDKEKDAETKKAEILKEHPDFNVEIFSQESETYQQLLQKAKASSQY